jgi:leucyl aminopeptidase
VNGERPILLFDLVGTLVAERTAADGARLDRIRAFPRVLELLRELREEARLGVLSFDPDLDVRRVQTALGDEPELAALLDPDLVFAPGAGALPPLPASGLTSFVGLHARDRRRARQEGWRVAPHPVLARALLHGEAIHYLRLEASGAGPGFPWQRLLAGRAIAPLHGALEPSPTLYVVAGSGALEIPVRVVDVERLGSPEDAELTSLYLVQVSSARLAASEAGRAYLRRLEDELPFLRETPQGLLLPIPGALTADDYHPPEAAHGHSVELVPSELPIVQPQTLPPPLVSRQLSTQERAQLASLGAAAVQQYLLPLTGGAPVDTGQVSNHLLVSRHTDHPDNPHATDWLLATLGQICGVGNVWKFPCGPAADGETRFDVVAEIPGSDGSAGLVVGGGGRAGAWWAPTSTRRRPSRPTRTRSTTGRRWIPLRARTTTPAAWRVCWPPPRPWWRSPRPPPRRARSASCSSTARSRAATAARPTPTPSTTSACRCGRCSRWTWWAGC